ncbi:DUF2398 family protein [Actinophytocola algeriensis]|uniref:Uncharacterized protein (TIGR02678 family) n=1 Tax=Actinophytocola algeriensis TaxID=1768010 RepID=A0A7W7VDM4_9PSEU|nr:DUF2398 family protein [Actinophytocola algeriensis]MBB4906239.1 uncharacterized protein (TIGR02678 family) [Actinophytocola algeriensis]MBE1472076.1 uncharacterized protein (TIGR02678 family) [Actinophytocola algeriensis]
MTTTTTGTREHRADSVRAAARVLLMTPVVTSARHPETFALIRGHASDLRRLFNRVLGYQLVVESTFARLRKPPLSDDTVVRPARTGNDRPFSSRTYTYLALVCASLLSPGTGDQVLMNSLVEQVRADAVTAGVTAEDTIVERRHLVRAIGLLVDWGVLTETDGSVAGWENRQEEALLDVNRPLLPHLLTRALRDVDGSGAPARRIPCGPSPLSSRAAACVASSSRTRSCAARRTQLEARDGAARPLATTTTRTCGATCALPPGTFPRPRHRSVRAGATGRR